MTELKPCPFCGEQPRKVYKSSGQTTHIECPGCRAQFPRSTNENAFDDAWNTRVEKTCVIEIGSGSTAGWWVCQSCGAPFDMVGALACMQKKKPNYCPNYGAKVVDD